MKKVFWTGIVIVIANFVTSIILYPKLPEKLASHWNAQGVVDGWSDKSFGVYFFPFLILGLFILLYFIPRIDPKKQNIEKFQKYYNMFLIVFLLFMSAINLQTLLWNLGTKISPLIFFPVGFAFLAYSIGIMVEHAQQNFFIGIRTPWTLASESVWDKTHRIAGKFYKIAAVLSLIGVFFQKYAILFVIVPIIAASIYVMIFSYFEFKKEQRG